MNRSLLVDNAPDTAGRFALFTKGFRPFFLLAALFAASMLPLWLLVLFGGAERASYLDPVHWHAHEMIFGFTVAVIAGFLLTAVGNWTKRETLVGAPLSALSALWIAGRVAMTAPLALPPVACAFVDLLFLPALGIALARPLIAAKSRRNFVVLGILLALFLANLAMHLDALGIEPGWADRGAMTAVDVVVLLLLVMSGRVMPMFTRNATGIGSIRSIAWLDGGAIGAMVLFTILDASMPERAITWISCGFVSFLVVARAARWGTLHAFREPLLWILHLGYAWIPIGLALRALSHFDGSIPRSMSIHALTAGAIGAMTLGMMARVSLGHTGRLLRAPWSATVAFAMVLCAAALRVLVPILPASWYRASLTLAGLGWAGAFLLFLAGYGHILIAPRADAR